MESESATEEPSSHKRQVGRASQTALGGYRSVALRLLEGTESLDVYLLPRSAF